MRKLSTGQLSTLGSYRDNCAALFGEESPQVAFFDNRIKGSPDGREEEVIQDEQQMMVLILSL